MRAGWFMRSAARIRTLSTSAPPSCGTSRRSRSSRKPTRRNVGQARSPAPLGATLNCASVKRKPVLMRAAILASLTATLVATQDQPPPATFRTEANYVRVDVYATQDGVALSDLTRTDFEVLEDRVPQRIEQFERVAIRPAGAQET